MLGGFGGGDKAIGVIFFVLAAALLTAYAADPEFLVLCTFCGARSTSPVRSGVFRCST
jgi:hypothetical protein